MSDPSAAPTAPPASVLLRGTVVSGLLVLTFHTGFPMACAITPGARVAKVPLQMELPPQLGDELVLRRDVWAVPTTTVGRDAALELVSIKRARIQRGTLLEVSFVPPDGAARTVEAAFAGIDADGQKLFVSADGDDLEHVPLAYVREVTVLGEEPSGHIGRGMLIGGLSTAAVSAVVGTVLVASTDKGIGRNIVGLCSATIGGGLTLVGAGVGAAVGASQADDERARAEHPIGPTEWLIDDATDAEPGQPRIP